MTRQILIGIWSIATVASATAGAQIAPPQVPKNLKAPATEVVLLKALGKGNQIYACSAKPGDEGQFAWVLDRPQAELIGEKGAVIGKHYSRLMHEI